MRAVPRNGGVDAKAAGRISISGLFADLHRASADAPELLEILPREEVPAWFEGGETA